MKTDSLQSNSLSARAGWYGVMGRNGRRAHKNSVTNRKWVWMELQRSRDHCGADEQDTERWRQ